ncbi:MAG: hypothetical protein AB1896_04645, partial [Thermodesulfobacteriota bacterium]
MDLYKKTLFDRIHRLTQKGEVDAFQFALLLKEALKYEASDAFILTELAAVLLDSGLLWEAYAAASKAYRLGGDPQARRIMTRLENPPLPEIVELEVSTACNLACPLCRHGAGRLPRRDRFLALDDFRLVWGKLKKTTRRLRL